MNGKVVSTVLFLVIFTLFDALVWGRFFFYMPVIFQNLYHQLYMIAWILGSVLLGAKYKDSRISIIALSFFLFNVEDVYYYLILHQSLPATFGGIYAFGIADPSLRFVLAWNALGYSVMLLTATTYLKSGKGVETTILKNNEKIGMLQKKNENLGGQ